MFASPIMIKQPNHNHSKTFVPQIKRAQNREFICTKKPYQPQIIIKSNYLLIFSLVAILIVVITSNNIIEAAHDDETTTTPTIDSNVNINLEAGPVSSNNKQTNNNDFRAIEALDLIRDWSSRFGREIFHGTQEATCLISIRDKFDPGKSDSGSSIVSIDWTRMHGEIVKTLSNTMGWHKMAVEAIAKASEQLASEHVYNKSLRFDYVDVHRLHNVDEEEAMYGQTDSTNQFSNDSMGTLEPPINLPPGTNGDYGSGSQLDNNNNQEIGQLDANGQLIGSQLDAGSSSTTEQEIPPEPLPTPSKLESIASVTPTSSSSPLEQPSALQAATVLSAQSIYTQVDLSSAGSQSEWQTPIRFLKLSKHKNFGDVLINTDESAVHIPVHIFPGEEQVMNGIAWSDGLTKVFRDNFVRNPKLTNQYFASQNGFMRLYPAQKWQIPRSDPDLYDARMRPWYVAGASSRKDVIILVDSSGSMTGSRRDIARGVVFEILDTLTDNDHFLILKFSDTIQQVGVPTCEKMRMERKRPSIPLRNTFHTMESSSSSPFRTTTPKNENETDVDSLYLAPATGRNVRHIKTNFTIPTSGIANFSHALITAFEVLRNYQDSDSQLGSQCNQAIMLITDGSPSDFEEIFNRYNYPNAPVRVFTYLIGREAGDVTHTKMMACHNRGYYTHVINLAEVRETVQQYIPVMARPLVLSGIHPITWTPAYSELTYQILTDWIWENKRRDKARAIIAANNARGGSSSSSMVSATSSSSSSNSYVPDIRVTNDDLGSSFYSNPEDEGYEESLEEELEAIDLFGYNSNPDCFWQTRRNDLLTTVVQPVYDKKNESIVAEKFLVKNVWTLKETVMKTAKLLGIAAADMKINDIIALAPSHKLGANGYAIMLTNNGFAMHHPDLRSILEPLGLDPSEKNMRILKPFFSSLDFTQVEHILNQASDNNILALRKEAVSGLTGWRELQTKRTLDCQKRVQSRKQSFYYKPIQQFPFSFLIAIPQPYGSHKIEAQIEIKSSLLPEKLTTYFTTSDYDIWTVHPDYQYCDGPSNNTITTLLDMFQRIEAGKLDDIQWRATESSKPPVFYPGKIICDKNLVQSLVYDAVKTFGFSERCDPPSPNAESNLLGMFGVRFSFLATRSGLTRVRHYDADDITIKKEALAFARKHARAIDETFYSRTVDYNMLINDTATLIQVPFNTFEKIRDRLDRYEMNQILNGESSISGQLESQLQPGSLDSGNQEGHFAPSEGPITRLGVKDMNFIEKLDILTNSSLHVIATQSIIVNEGAQRAVVGVSGVFYDYASFVWRFFNSTNSRFSDGRPVTKSASCYTGTSTDESCDETKAIRCGWSNDTIDCLLIDNNGYIIISEDLDYIGRHLKAYDTKIMSRLVNAGVFHEVNITDYQAVCLKLEEKQLTSSAFSVIRPDKFFLPLIGGFLRNLISAIMYTWTIMLTIISLLLGGNQAEAHQTILSNRQQLTTQTKIPISELNLPNKTYLRPCEKTLTLYETRPSKSLMSSKTVDHYTTRCGCNGWFVYEQVPKTNLLMVIVDTTPSCRQGCDPTSQLIDPTDPMDAKYPNRTQEDQVCSMLERESQLYRKKLDSCFSHHPDEGHIKLCGAAGNLNPQNLLPLTMTIVIPLILSRTMIAVV